MSVGRWEDDFYSGEAGAEVDRGGSKFAHILLFAIAAFFAIFLIWADMATLDEVTRGDGKIIPTRQTQTVSNLEGGIVAEIFAQEGDIVEENEVLLRIDNVQAASDLRESRGKYLSLLAAVARLEARVADLDDIDFPDEVLNEASSVARDEKQLFDIRRSRAREQLQILEDQAQQKRQELAELSARIQQLQRTMALTQQELDILEPLVQQGVSPRLDLIRVQQKLQDIATELEGLRLAVPRTRTAVSEARRRIGEKRSEQQAEIQTELNEKRVELNAMAENLTAETDRVTRTEVRSPVRGTIKSLAVNTIGGVVKPGESLVEIVPLEDSLLVEARIRPADRAQLRPGLNAKVKITAYDYSIHGDLPAQLVDISPDTITNEEGESFYRIRLRTDQNNLGPDKPIIPGMTATVDILTGEKTVLTYLLKPLIKARDGALRER